MAAVFTITELLADGAVVPGGPARFEWHADEPGRAGRRAMPRRPFVLGTVVRHKRTDYPGGDSSSHQVFGPAVKPITFEGCWDDRYNAAGYARTTRRLFNDMVRRGNLVRVEMSGLAWVGLITEADYPYDYDAKISYRFTFDPQREEDAAPLRPAGNPNRPLSATALTDSLSTDVNRLRDLREGAIPPLGGGFLADFDGTLAEVESAFAEVDATLNTRIVQPAEETRLALLRMGQLFGQIRGASFAAATTLVGWKSDVQVAYQTAESVLRFEEWMRLTAAQLRLLGLHAYESQQEVGRRADPDAKAVYRPRQGEHLMSVSQRFYGSPHQWRGLMSRNGLTYPVMTGDEVLVVGASGQDA